jgi:hypothetical protein
MNSTPTALGLDIERRRVETGLLGFFECLREMAKAGPVLNIILRFLS